MSLKDLPDEEMKRKILQGAMTTRSDPTRKEFNGSIKETFGERGYRLAQELWKEGLLGIGRMGSVVATFKGIVFYSEHRQKSRERT